jgi:hypothetical protein
MTDFDMRGVAQAGWAGNHDHHVDFARSFRDGGIPYRRRSGIASLTILRTTVANCLGSGPVLYGTP